jgi:oligoribonuclease NrnB/cAMP/cGMP phosphodiesterase (DHH superfamily)
MKKVINFYHKVDIDGWMSGAITKLFFDSFDDVELVSVPFNYNEKVTHNLDEFDEIVITDIMIPPELMKKYEDKLLILDHHATMEHVIKVYDINPGIGINFDKTYAACELTWEYFFPEDRMPPVVRVFGLYDSFRFKTKNDSIQDVVLMTQYGGRAQVYDIESASKLLKADLNFMKHVDGKVYITESPIVEELYKAGSTIYEYLKVDVKKKLKQGYINDVRIEEKDYRIFCLNAERLNPVSFGIDVIKEYGVDFVVSYWYDGAAKQWICSLYSSVVDVSKIAQIFGGGGHAGASGCQSDTFPEICRQ